MQVTFELDQNFVVTDRQVYSVLDWLGDIGGLETALMLILGYMNSFVNYEAFEDFLVSKLFRPSKNHSSHAMFSMGFSTGIRSEILNPKKNGCLMKRWHKVKVLICRNTSKSDRRQRLFTRGRRELQHELDALTLLKYVRGLEKLIDIKIKPTS